MSKSRPGEVKLRCRVAYPHLDKVHGFMGNEAKYDACIVMNEEQAEAAQTAINDLLLDKHGAGYARKSIPTPLRDGSEDRPSSEHFKNMTFFTARSKYQPQTVTFKSGQMARIAPEEILSGYHCIVVINFYIPDRYSRVCAGLGNILLIKPCDVEDMIGMSASPEDQFGDFASEFKNEIDTAKGKGNAGLAGFDVPDEDIYPTPKVG